MDSVELSFKNYHYEYENKSVFSGTKFAIHKGLFLVMAWIIFI